MDHALRTRLLGWLRRENLGSALLASPFSVDWASGHESTIETGPNPFAGGPSLLLVQPERATLLYPDSETPDLAALGLRGLAYASYSPRDPLAPTSAYADKFLELIGGLDLGRLGVEFAALPAFLAASLAPSRSIDGVIAQLRAVKTPAEIAAIRAACALCDHAQALLPTLVRPGRSELEIWGDLRAALEVRAGRRLPLLADFVSGPRTAEIGGPPGARVLAAGDWVLADIVPRLGCFWGDICGVISAGPPSPRFAELKEAVGAALDLAIAQVRPGAIPEEIDQATRDFLRQRGYPVYPHHTGHGIGVSYHEEPRIVAGNRTPLAENMVIALEPGIYLPGECGVRLEDVVLVTAEGCEVLTRHRRQP